MLLTFILPLLALITASHCETTENEITEVTEVEEATEANSTIPPILDATASKLVRYRSKAPPMNYHRYKNRNVKRPRPRIKIPKYGPPPQPLYKIPDQKNYYKHQPEIYTSTLSYKPSYSYDEVHYEVSSEYPETHIPVSSYETHATDLDYYSDSYSKKKAPQYEYPKPQKPYIAPRPPQKTYGIPKEQGYNSYDSYSGDDYKAQYPPKHEVKYEISYHEESPKQSYGPPPHPPEKEEYEQFPPYGAPPKEEVQYHPPEEKYEPPVSSYHPQEQSNDGPYPVYDKKLPNAGYSYNNHFAEPPTDIHYTYSPSYDISPPKHGPPQNTYGPPPPPRNSYGPPSDSYGPPSDGYGPPAYNQNYHPPSDSYHQPSGGNFAEPPGSYLPPVHHPDELPLKKNHMPPGYDYPKSSYEVPLYDPIPFESTTAEQDYFPPNHDTRTPSQYEHASETSTHIQQIPPQGHRPSPPSTTSTTETHEPVPEPNNKVHRFAPHNLRANYITRHESTSKFPAEASSSEPPSSKYLDKILSTTSTFRTRRKRKRTKAPSTTEKHILDAPELQEAFESGHDQTQELAAHSSNIKENIHTERTNAPSPIQTLTDFSPSHSWNPMRIRSRQPNPQRGQRTAETALQELKNIEVLSIEKSHSHSYYAGTVPPPPVRTRTLDSRADRAKKNTIPSTTFKAEDAMQPTRSQVIDKTYFKAKDNEEDFYDGTGELPKNHKLF